MIVFSLVIFFCVSADECRWYTAMHFAREELCHELGREYLTEPQVLRYKCIAAVRD